MASFSLPKLPFSKGDLAPLISSETLDYHYGKHHQTYVNNLNRLTEGQARSSLIEIIQNGEGGVFNNAAQVWNHAFYWDCMSSPGQDGINDELKQTLSEHFGSLEDFQQAFQQKAATLFGSGWTWLVKESSGKLAIVNTSNADNPLQQEAQPILTCDVWEHAYYIDKRNNRVAYLEDFWKLVNWSFVTDQLQAEKPPEYC